MPEAYGIGQVCAPTQEINTMKRTRAVELCQHALKVAEFMDNIGITSDEYCYFGRLMQDILKYEK